MIDAIYYGVGATDFWTAKTENRSGYTCLTKEVYVSNIENDVYNGAVVTIDTEHFHIHAGEHFFVQSVVDLTSNSAIDFITKTTTSPTHIIFAINQTTGAVKSEIWEGVTFSGGTQIVAINNNRLSSIISPTLHYGGVSSTIGSALKYSTQYIGSGTNPSQSQGGSKRESYEVILKPNTNYLLRLTNLTNSVNNISFEVSYYV